MKYPLYLVEEWMGSVPTHYNKLVIYKLRLRDLYQIYKIVRFNCKVYNNPSWDVPYKDIIADHMNWKIHKYNTDADLLLNHPELL